MKYSLAIGRKRLPRPIYHEICWLLVALTAAIPLQESHGGTTHTTWPTLQMWECFPSFPDPWFWYIILLMCWSGICLPRLMLAFLKAANLQLQQKTWQVIYEGAFTSKFVAKCEGEEVGWNLSKWGKDVRVKSCKNMNFFFVVLFLMFHIRVWLWLGFFMVFHGFSQNQMNFQYECHRPDSVHLTAEQFPGDFLFASENRWRRSPFQRELHRWTNHWFSGAFAVSFREGKRCLKIS